MASFLSTLFGGGAETDAANRNRASLGDYTVNSNNALNTGLERTVGSLTGQYGQADSRLAGNTALYGDLRTAGTGILDRGRSEGLAALGSASGLYDPLISKYGAGTDLYLDSLGTNGAAGNQRAVDAFQAGPGYEFTLDQGLQALNRRRAAAGMLNSGNADVDAITYGTGLANQTYGSWQDRLAGLINPELSAVSGKAGAQNNIANYINGDTLARLGLESGVTQGMAGVNTARAANDVALGNTLGNVYTNDASNRVGINANVLSGNTAASNMQAQGEASGARNALNAGISLASLAAGGMGGGSFAGLGGSGGMLNNLQNFGFNPARVTR